MTRTTEAGIAALLESATQLLHTDSPRLDAEVLLAHVLGKPRSYLRAWPERVPEPATLARFTGLLARRSQGEPVAHLTGVREFWSLKIGITPDTLIPRPDTETLVELALARIPVDAGWQLADLGTGSGAIALALASERPGCRVTATDNSSRALAVAHANATRLGLRNIDFVEGSWCDALTGRRCELIVSNPPYIPNADPHLEQGDVRFEPRGALVAGSDGLEALRVIIRCAPAHLGTPGWLVLEHGFDQQPAVHHMLAAAGYRDISGHRDSAGHSRVSCALRPSE